MAAISKIIAVILFIYFIKVCVYLYMHMYNFLCSDSLLYTSLSTLHGVYTRDCSCSTIHVVEISGMTAFSGFQRTLQ